MAIYLDTFFTVEVAELGSGRRGDFAAFVFDFRCDVPFPKFLVMPIVYLNKFLLLKAFK